MKRNFFISFILLCTFTANVLSQWVECNKGWEGTAQNILIVNDYIISASTMNSIFISSDGGIHWTKVKYKSHSVWSLTNYKDTVYACTNNGIFKSTDFGYNWISSGLEGFSVRSIALNDDIFCAGTYNQGIFISTNNGTIWNQTTINDKYIMSIIIHNSIIFAGTSNSGVFVSTDNGINWSNNNSYEQLSNAQVICFEAKEEKVFAGTFKNGIYLSTDYGQNWIPKYNGLPYKKSQNIVSIKYKEKNLFISSDALYLSTDDGNSWITTNLTNLSGSLVINKNKIYIGTKLGVFYSSDDGMNWSTHSGLRTSRINSIGCLGNLIIVGTQQGVFLSSDLGESWTQKNGHLLELNNILDLTISNNKIFVVYENGLFTSSNFGVNWIKSDFIATYANTITSDDRSIIVGVVNDGIYLSTDYGLTWSKKNSSLFKSVRSISIKDSVIVTCDKNVYISTNFGDNWEKTNYSDNGVIYSLLLTSEKIYVGTELEGLFISSDIGKNWIQKKNESFNSNFVKCIVEYNNNIIIGTVGGVYFSTNNGDNWIQTGPLNYDVNALFVHEDYIYAGFIDLGFLRAKLSDLITDLNEKQQNLNLFKIYPNPTCNTLNLYFNNSSITDLLEIKLSNLLGFEMSLKLLNKTDNLMVFDISFLPNGIYFVNIINGNICERFKFIKADI